jgi:hypothetical protein
MSHLGDPRRTHLERLAEAVGTATDLNTRLLQPSRSDPVVLRVTNRTAPALSEEIGCDMVEGEWWYVWSWNNTIGPAGDPDSAAHTIQRVLLTRT